MPRVQVCPNCGETIVGHPRPLELGALVLGALVSKRTRLAPHEVRHLRASLGTARYVADLLGVTASQLSRWENGAAPISALGDRLLRLLIVFQYKLDAPDLREIDSKRAIPVTLRIALGKRGWRVVEPERASAPRQSLPSSNRSETP